jgi:Ni,Fe-hydrogenase III large subunit
VSVGAAGGYRERIAGLVGGAWTFGGLHASGDGRVVHTLLVGAAGELAVESVAAVGGSVPSIVDLAPAAQWDEREAHDLYGVGFHGHEPLRPLAAHDPDVARWTVPVRGHDPYQVAVGPIHAGVIESGHFRFHLVGDRILLLDARLFYKHRGLERAAVGASLDDGIAYAQRACAACAVSNGVAYAQACEHALGLRLGREAARTRTVLLELERVWSHLNDIAAICAGVGLAAGTAHFAGLTERARRLNARLTGHRFLFGSVRVGGSELALDGAAVDGARSELAELRRGAARGWRELMFNSSFVDRLPDIGVVAEADARRLGTVGPAARAAGLRIDARACAGDRLAYHDHAAAVPARAGGDVQARLEQRELELTQSFGILDEQLRSPLRRDGAEPLGERPEIGVGLVESPRGRTVCLVEHDGERVERLRLRTGSYANWPSVAFAAADNLLPDFPLINKSFELCYACADR